MTITSEPAVRPAHAEDCSAAIEALGHAFADDPLMRFLFHDHPRGGLLAASEFFSILLRARLALGMPALILWQGDNIRGAVMGYDTTRPTWPQTLSAEWERFESGAPHFRSRMAVYESIADAHQPAEPHYYLGVIGVHPALQGQGAGKRLLEAFCELSRNDRASRGVYLETASERSLAFYLRCGFVLRGEGSLDGAPLWCVYKPN